MSFRKLIPSLLLCAVAVGVTAAPAKAQVNLGSGLNITKISDLTGVQIANGKLTATGGKVEGTLAGLPFTTNITNFALQLVPPTVPPAPPAPGCSVLDLELAPIDIDLLGLHVDTSAICLSITALPGEGILGDLLCGLAGGLDLGDILGDLPGLLTRVLGAAADKHNPGQGQGEPEDICDGECEVLDLALGPVDLTLLGLNVFLDNCDEGPVQVCVSASQDEGLLGGLLCGLTGNGGLLGNLGILEDLVDAIQDALGNVNPTAKQVKQLSNRLAGQLTDRLADGDLSDADLAKVTKTIKQALH